MAGQERAGITVEDLSCRYREEYVFSGLNFMVKKARVTGHRPQRLREDHTAPVPG